VAALDWAELVVGVLLVLLTLSDLFQSVVVPRRTTGARLAPVLLPISWSIYHWVTLRVVRLGKREEALGSFAPLAVMLLLVTWVCGLVLGYGLVLHALAGQISPQPHDLGTALYFSALCLLTLGFGDIVPVGPAARILVLSEAGAGLGTVALTISFLFSLFASFQRREAQVITLDASAGAPPSGLTLLETCRRLNIPDHLAQVFDDWKLWSAEVLEGHLAYPVLNYFRSSHDHESWVSALGAVMDAATLVITTVEDGPKGHAKLIYQLRESEQAWADFGRLRANYALPLNQMARYFDIPPARWVGDRSYVRHLAAHARADSAAGAPTK
jgi:hypothetical protein